jgi:NDP-sugar pyrophosphorylase family protein
MKLQNSALTTVSLLAAVALLAPSATGQSVDSLMSANMFRQSVFAQGYVTLSASAVVNGHVWTGAATTIGAGADVRGTVVSGAATTLGADVVISGDVRSGAATTLGAGAVVAGTVVSGGATTLGAGATKGTETLAPGSQYNPVIGELELAQSFLSELAPTFEKITHNVGVDEIWTSGVHKITGAMSVSAGVTITLDAEGNAEDFIINVSSYVSFGSGVHVVVANAPVTGSQPRVIWNVTGTYISLGADADIEGILMAKTYVSTGANSKAHGGAYSATAYVATGAGSTIGTE